MNRIVNGQRVIIRLAGDKHHEYEGTVIDAKKSWVEIPDYFNDEPFIADESNITSIREKLPQKH